MNCTSIRVLRVLSRRSLLKQFWSHVHGEEKTNRLGKQQASSHVSAQAFLGTHKKMHISLTFAHRHNFYPNAHTHTHTQNHETYHRTPYHSITFL